MEEIRDMLLDSVNRYGRLDKTTVYISQYLGKLIVKDIKKATKDTAK